MTKEYNWKLCNIQDKKILDNYKWIIIFEENEVNLNGIIREIQNGANSNEEKYLINYKNANIDAYTEYFKKETGLDTLPSQANDVFYIKKYIEDENLYDDFNNYIKNNPIVKYKSTKQRIEELIQTKMLSILEQTRGYLFIYRTQDKKGVYLEQINKIKSILQ